MRAEVIPGSVIQSRRDKTMPCRKSRGAEGERDSDGIAGLAWDRGQWGGGKSGEHLVKYDVSNDLDNMAASIVAPHGSW